MSKIEFILADTTEQAMRSGLNFVMQKAQQNKFENYVVLVPDTKTMMAEKHLLSICDSGAFSNIYIYTLSRLLEKISPVNKNLVLSKQASIMIVRKIILQNINSLVCYKKTALTNGFAETIFGTISQLKSSNVSVSEFYDMIENVSPSLKIKMQDIALIYDEYQKYIENKYIDQSDLLTILGETVKDSEFVSGSEFYFLGYDSVTSEALSVCNNIIHGCKKFVVGASYLSNQNNSHIADNEVFTKFKKIADTIGVEYFPHKIKTNYLKDFLHIKDNLFAYPPKQQFGANSVEILSCTNTIQEVDFVSQKIAKLIKNGARYNQIGIVCPNIEEYSDTIQKSFDEYNFSYFIAEPYDFAEHPLFALIKSYLSVIKKNCEKSSVIEFLSNVLLEQTDKISNFINYVEQYGIDHHKFKKPFERFDEKIISAEEFAQIENLRKSLAEVVQIFDENAKSAQDYTSLVLKFLDRINIDQKLENFAEMIKDDKVYYSVTLQAKDKFDLVIQQLQTFLGDEPMPLDMYQALLTSGLVSADISLVPISQDSIIISKNADGIDNVDYLFVMNVTDGNFPSKEQDCGIILDKEIKELGKQSQKTIEPTIKTINRRERYRAYETLLLAKKGLILSYHEEGGEDSNKPSSIIDNLKAIFGGDKYMSVQKYVGEFNLDDNDYANNYLTKAKLEKYLCTEIGNKKGYGNFEKPIMVGDVYFAIKDDLPQNLQSHIKNINNSKDYTLTKAKDLYFLNKTTSTSQLERYFTCPFLFYTDYGLRLKENPTSKLKQLDTGNILHKVAELFMQKFAKNSKIDIKNTAKTIIDRIIKEEYVAEDNKLLAKIITEESIRLCERLADEQLHSHFKPIALEKSFGTKNGGVNLAENIVLEGKIDRIDKYNDRFRIIDYKTGKIEDNIKRVFYGKKIQLVTYLLAMENSGLKPAGVLYYPIRNEFSSQDSKPSRMKGFLLNDSNIIRDMDTTMNSENLQSTYFDAKLTKNGNLFSSGNLLTDEQFEELKQYCINLSNIAIKEILEGNTTPSPIRLSDSDSLKCNNCAFAGICGVQKTKYANGRKCYTNIKINDIMSIGGEQ